MPRPFRSPPGLLFSTALVLVAASATALGQDPAPEVDEAYIKAHYTKTDVRIPMRDGVRLFASVYAPRDTTKAYPILLQRTPYGSGPYGADKYPSDELGPSPHFARSGYIVVMQDVRGCFLSEGDFLDVRPQNPGRKGKEIDESTDAYDTVEWLVKNVKNNNGRVGLWGISYPGFYAAVAAIDAHPAIKAVSPQAPLVDWFMGDDTHHNGAFFLQQEFMFDAEFGIPRAGPTTNSPQPFNIGTRDAYQFFLRLGPLPRVNEKYFKNTHVFWNEVMEHGTYDAYWKARNLLPHLKDIRPAVLTVGGWFDAEDLYGALHTYGTIERTSRSENLLVMGPWVHGNWSFGDGDSLGPVRFGSKTSPYFREKIEFPFFEHHLKGRGEWNPPDAWVFETGKNRWHLRSDWPPHNARKRSIYLRDGGRLAFEPPTTPGQVEADEFISDPASPVPYTRIVSPNYPPTFMIEDQRFAARRPDVLTYKTEVLTEDVTVAGPIEVEMFVSTTGTDADWVVKLIDVQPGTSSTSAKKVVDPPGGAQQLVRGDVMRGKFRKSFETPTAFVPGEPTAVRFTLQDMYHTFRPGHRIMVQVQSSWFPLVDRNPQTFVDIYHAKESDFREATHKVYHAPGRASRLELGILP
jgi:putative CocE/NonD family hydrolase